MCDQTCGWCARDWFKWLKAREANMRRTLPDGSNFANAAATSNVPGRTPEGVTWICRLEQVPSQRG
jgi:hypothetical protein